MLSLATVLSNQMTKDNKTLFSYLAMTTLIIGAIFSVIVYFVFGTSAAYFFVTVFAIPIGAICSLLLLMLINAMK